MLIKLAGSIVIIAASTAIGIMLAKFKADRVREIRTLISALNMLEIEIKFALNTLPDAFMKISKTIDEKIGELFSNTAENIIGLQINACNAWQKVIKQSSPRLSMNREDKEILLTLGNYLGEIDTENQIKNIKLLIEQLKCQGKKAEEDKIKGEKLYKSLGILSGLAVVIILF